MFDICVGPNRRTAPAVFTMMDEGAATTLKAAITEALPFMADAQGFGVFVRPRPMPAVVPTHPVFHDPEPEVADAVDDGDDDDILDPDTDPA